MLVMTIKRLCSILFIIVKLISLNNAINPPSGVVRLETRSTSFVYDWDVNNNTYYKIDVQYGHVSSLPPSSNPYIRPPYRSIMMTTGNAIQPSTSYHIHLFAINAFNSADYGIVATTCYTAPPAPTGVQISNIYTTQFLVNWQHNTAGSYYSTSKYIVTYGVGNTVYNAETSSGSSTSLTITGLVANTDYNVSVVGWSSSNIYTDDSVATIATTDPGQVTSLTLSYPTGSSGDLTTMIKVYWNKPDGGDSIDYYHVYWYLSTDGSYISSSTVYHVVGTTSYSYTIKNLNPGESYDVRIHAHNSVGTGQNSYDTRMTYPGQVTSLTLSYPTGSSADPTTMIKVYWNKPDGGDSIDYYHVYWYLSSGGSYTTSSTVYHVVGTTSYSYTIKNLNPGESYDVRIHAHNSVGTGQDSYDTRMTYPSKLTSLNLNYPSGSTSERTTMIKVDWNKPTGGDAIDNYTVEWWPSSDYSSASTYTINHITGTTSYSYTINSLTPAESYSVRVKARNSAGPGESSSTLTRATVPGQLTYLHQNQPAGSSADPTTMIKVEWNNPDGGDSIYHYHLLWYLTKDSSYISQSTITHVVGITSYSYTINNLTPGESYDLDVYAHNSVGYGQSSYDTQMTYPSKLTSLNLNYPSGSTSERTTMIKVDWNKPTGGDAIDNYTVEWWPSSDYSSASTYTINHITGNTSYSYTINSLTPAESYSVRVKARNSAGPGESSSTLTRSTIPGEPISLKQSYPTGSSADPTTMIKVEWNKPDGGDAINYYYVYWKLTTATGYNNGSPRIYHVVGITSYSYTIINLTPAQSYDVRAYAYNSYGNSHTTDMTQMTYPDKLTSLNLNYPSGSTSDRTTMIKVDWNKPTGGDAIDNYTVEWWPSSDYSSASTYAINHITGNTSYSYTINSLTPAESYSVRVKARNSAGPGETSSTLTRSTVPDEPISLKQSYPTGSSADPTTMIKVEWNKPDGGDAINYYYVYWKLATATSYNNVSPRIYHVVGITSYSYTIINLTPAQSYDVRAYAYNSYGNSHTTDMTQMTYPDKLTSLNLNYPSGSTSERTTMIKVDWNKPTGGDAIDNYTVEWWPSSDYSSASTYTINHVTGTTSYSYTINSLTPAESYSVRVKARNSAGPGESFSTLTRATVPEQPTSNLNFPTGSSADPTTMIKVDWNKPDGGDAITYYRLEWKRSTDNSNISSTTVSHVIGTISYTYTIDNLTPGESYDVRVRARNSVDYSSPSEMTQRTNPDSVHNVMITQNASHPEKTLDLKWEAPRGIGETITITYYGQPSLINGTYDVGFADVKTTFNVIPGNNYTVAIVVHNKGMESIKMFGKMNSKPLQPVYEVEPKAHKLTISWNNLDGYCEGFYITIISTDALQIMKLNAQTTTYTIYHLNERTNYTILMSSWIIDIFGNLEKSTATSSLHETFADSTDIGLIVGTVIAAFVVVVIAVLAIWYYRSRKQKLTMKEIKRNVKISFIEPSSSSSSNKDSSKAVALSRFHDYMKKNSKNLMREFKDLARYGIDKSTRVAMLPENINKNRYRTGLPYDENRVRVTLVKQNTNSDYINASYIKGQSSVKEYIATQGPLRNAIDEFWRMIWKEKTKTIIMLGEPVVKGEIVCCQYWPVNNNPVTHDGIIVRLVSASVNDTWSEQTLELKYKRDVRIINHFKFHSWHNDDFDEDKVQSLTRFAAQVRMEMDKIEKTGPAVVHCNNGCGRTGTFIAIDRLLQQMKKASSVNIYELVCEMRGSRQLMVENYNQYQLIHNAVKHTVGPTYEECLPLNLYSNSMGTANNAYESVLSIYEVPS